MRFCSLLAFAVALGASTSSCTPEPLTETPEVVKPGPADDDDGGEGKTSNERSMTIDITIGEKVFKADIEDTETGNAFLAKLPLTLDMDELNGNEKYCYGVSLPKSDRYFDSIAAGDLMLYSGNCIVLFYGPAGGFRYTRIGKVADPEGLKEALGTGSVKVSFTCPM